MAAEPFLLLIAGALIGTIATYFIVRSRVKTIHSKEAEKRALQELMNNSLRYQLETEQVISYFATSMVGKLTVEDVLWDVARNCISKLDFEDCIIYLKDEERDVLLQRLPGDQRQLRRIKY